MCGRSRLKVPGVLFPPVILPLTITMSVSLNLKSPFPPVTLMNEHTCNFIRPLLAFITSIKNVATEVESRLKHPVPQRSLGRNQSLPLEPTWLTLLRKDGFISRILSYEAFDSNEVFESDNSDNESTTVEQLDEFGSVKHGEKWFNVDTKECWSSYPFGN